MRWADLDQLGHVNNVVYVDYLQEARVDLLRAHGRGPRALADGLVVVRHEVTYLKPLTYDFRPVSIECWVTDIKAATFTMAYEIFHDAPASDGATVTGSSTCAPPPSSRRSSSPRSGRAGSPPRSGPRSRSTSSPTGSRAGVRRRCPSEVTSRYPIHVRFSDVDVYGHVNNVKYFEYLQEARISMIRELVPRRQFSVVVAQTDVDYLQPLLFRAEPYDCRTSITRVGTRSMTIESEIRDEDRVLARARVVVVFFDLAGGRSTEPDPEVRDVLVAASHPID